MFRIYQTDDGHELPFEYMPCSNITPKEGMAMVVSSGKLAIATGANKPAYICAKECSAAVAAGTVIPVVKVQADQRWKVKRSGVSSLAVGGAYTLHASSGLDITTTTTNGVFTLDEIDSSTNEVYGRFL